MHPTNPSRSRARLLVLGLAVVTALAGCGRSRTTEGGDPDAGPGDGGVPTDGGGPGDAGLVAVQVEPPALTLLPGLGQPLTARGVFADGSVEDVTGDAVWSTAGTGVVEIDDGGRVTALAPGEDVVVADVDGVIGEAVVTVEDRTIVDVVVTPANGRTGVGGEVPFSADARLDDGSRLDVTTLAVWTTSDPGVATVDEVGVGRGVSPGTATITASIEGARGDAELTVTDAALEALEISPVDPVLPVGGRVAFEAIGRFGDGTLGDVTASVVWTSSAPENVAIDAAGEGRALAEGTAIVSATLEGLEATSTVTVTGATLVELVVSPATAALTIDETVDLAVEGRFDDGTVADLTGSVGWTSDAPDVAAVSNAPGSAGRVTALTPGTARIVARQGGVEGAASIEVSDATLEALVVAPADAVVPVGASVPLEATGTFSDGSTRPVTSAVDWASADPTVATVSNAAGSAGVVSGNAPGTTEITASLDGIDAVARVTVTDSAVRSVEVTPANARTTVGLRTRYRAEATFDDGTVIDVTTQVTWTTEDETVASISNGTGVEGQLLAVAPGSTDVVATFDGVPGRTSVEVAAPTIDALQVTPIAADLPAGVTIQYQAQALFSNGTSQNVTLRADWSTVDSAVATVDARGRVTSVAAGTTTVSASFMGATGSTPLTVTEADVVEVQVTPVAPSLPVGGRLRFQAVAIFSDGSSRNVSGGVTWTSSDPAVLQVATTGPGRGLATALAAGTVTVTGTFDGVAGSQTVTVTDAEIEELQVTPPTWETPVDGVQQFQAVAIFTDGSSRNVTAQATWTSSATTVAQVTSGGGSRGRVTALDAGTATITGTFDGVSDTATVTVTDAVVDEIQVTPFAPEVAAGLPIQFQAVALYDDGTSVNVTGRATWTSSDTAVAEVSNAGGSTGRGLGVAAGTATIRARFDGVTGSTVLTVSAATIDRIQVTPFLPSLPAGYGVQMQATAIYTDDTTRNVTGLATWSSSDSAVAAVSNAFGSRGALSAVAAGSATITARFDGAAGSTSATVTGATLDSIDVTPSTATIDVRGTQAFQATGNFSDGSTLPITAGVTWSSTDLTVADVSNAAGSQGQATGFAAGETTIRARRDGVTGEAALEVD